MFKLFLRFYLLLLIFITLVYVYSNNVLLFDNPFTFDLVINGMGSGTASPTFNYIQNQLKEKPEASWNSILKQITPNEPHIDIIILPIEQIQLSPSQMKLFLNGQIVSTALFFHAPINNTTSSYYGATYQRIGNSSRALEFVMQSHQDTGVLPSQTWLTNFIKIELNKTPKSQSAVVLANFSKQQGINVKLIPLSQLTPEMRNYIIQHQYLYDSSDSLTGMITQLYYLYSPDEVLSIGPYHYPWYLQQIGAFFLLTVILAIALFMVFSLIAFYRSLKKLDRLAAAYGEGNFNYSVKISRLAALFPLYSNLKSMGQRIEQLIASHKELSQAVSHELKTPLARLKFALALAQESTNPNETQKALQDASEASNSLEHLISELLTYTKFDRQLVDLSKETIYLGPALRKILVNWSEHSIKTLKWEISPEADQASIKMAERYFQILIDNLLSNAFRYAASQIELKAYVDQKNIYIEIHDDGPGIPAEYREKIFEPFFSIDESRNKDLSGHGLGLAIVSRIISSHHGKIETKESLLLHGALFILSLPKI
ncbi:MAG: two component system sensor histidine kinase [Gammaproteobacteria bacterium]|jgi:signal transduction histidine kinase|nr:two component system sensor histidine kinase [Gammaproteobacteria bacterium]